MVKLLASLNLQTFPLHKRIRFMVMVKYFSEGTNCTWELIRNFMHAASLLWIVDEEG
jgi:hypothetical protein